MTKNTEKLLLHKLKELGELHEDYAKDEDTDARNVNWFYIQNKVEDIRAFFNKEISDAVHDAKSS